MSFVEALEPDKSGELVLANAINAFSKTDSVYGRVIEGQWHDAGNKEKYLEAIVDVALGDTKIAPAFRTYLEQKLAEDRPA
jgi:UTP--glucose-1-phosphate uridylyltransferase